MSATGSVPVTRPATVQKNSDGTYSVRIQHDDVAGTYTEVHFPNVVFAETLANGYAAFINGITKAEAVAKEVGPDLKADGEKILVAARKEAAKLESQAERDYDKLIKAAKNEAAALKLDAETLLNAAKAEAESLISSAKAELAKLHVTKTTVTPPSAADAPFPSVVPPPGVSTPAPAAKDEIEEV
jgi:regulator of protease activity HflC (stomatin/prohibitin superfamily)